MYAGGFYTCNVHGCRSAIIGPEQPNAYGTSNRIPIHLKGIVYT